MQERRFLRSPVLVIGTARIPVHMAFGVFHLDLRRSVDLGSKGAKDVTVVIDHEKPLSSDLLLGRRLGVDRQGRGEMREDAADEAGGCGKENSQLGVHDSIMSQKAGKLPPGISFALPRNPHNEPKK